MFDKFSLPDVVTVSRRTMIMSVVIGVVGMLVLLLVSQPWAALGLGIGLGLGMLNFRMIQRSVIKVGKRATENKRRPLAMNTLARMGLITVVALGLLFVKFPLGFGLLGGLALFQMILLLNVTRSMLKHGAIGPMASAVLRPGAPFDDDDEAIEVPAYDSQPYQPDALGRGVDRGTADGRETA